MTQLASRKLGRGLVLLATSLGYSATLRELRTSKSTFHERKGRPKWRLTTRPLAEQKRPRQIYKHGHIWTPIGKQRTSGTHTIHNLHVAEDNSYLAEGIITQTINPKETH